MTNNILTATAGIASSAIIESTNINDLAGTIVQVLIGIITIIKLLKPQNREKTTTKTKA